MGSEPKYVFSDLVDIPTLDRMLQTLYEIARIPSSIIDLDGKVLTGAGWQRICTHFHRANPEAARACVESDTRVRSEIERGEPFVVFRCPHGLVDSCCPVVIDGRHVANVFTGQLLHEPLDDETVERFRQQARHYAFDENAYLDALREVPVYPVERHTQILTFLRDLAVYMAQLSIARLRTQDQARLVEASELRLRTLVEETPNLVFIRSLDTGRMAFVNRRFREVLGYDVDELNAPGFDYVEAIIAPKSRATLVADYAAVLRGDDEGNTVEQSLLTRSGTCIEALVSRRVVEVAGERFLFGIIADVTDRKRAEEALHRRQQEFEALVENSPDAIARFDRDCRHVYVNSALERDFDVKKADLLGRTFREAGLPEELVDWSDRIIRGVLDSGRPADFEITYPTPIGPKYFLSRGVPELAPDGSVASALFVHRDVTRRKLAEQELQRVNEQLAATLDALPDVLFELDRDGRILDLRVPHPQAPHAQPERLVGKLVRDLVPPDAVRVIMDAIAEAIETGHYAGATYSLPMPSGLKWYELSIAARGDRSSPQARFVALARDVSTRRQAQEALRQSEAALLEAQRIAHVGSWAWDPAGDVVTWSEELHRIAGTDSTRPAPSLVELERFYTPESWKLLTRSVERALAEGKPYEVELEVIRPDGEHRQTLGRGEAVRDGEGKVVGLRGTVHDVTEQRRLEARLRQSEKMEAIGQLAGGVAHDFNNMLGAILGYAEMIDERTDDPEIRKCAAAVVSAAERSAVLTSQLLAFARRGKYEAAPVDLHTVIEEVVALLGRSIDKRIVVDRRLEADNAVVTGDASQLNSALLNLALNARDAMPAGGTLVFATRTVPAGEWPEATPRGEVTGERLLRVDVSDTGCGMSEETQSHLFEPFFTTKQPGKGTGLGLASVYGTIRNHGGVITVRSEPGKGSVFSLFLPVAAGRVEKPAGPPPASTVTRAARVLVVEDEEVLRGLVVGALERLGCQVRACANGGEAVAVYRHEWQAIDLVLLDLVMPVMGGYETLSEMRSVNPKVKVVVVTGYALDAVAQRMADLGAVAFLKKPFRLSELSAQVARALAG